MPLLCHLFSDTDVKRTQAIPLSLRDENDQLNWNYTIDGNYQVKSSYMFDSHKAKEASTSGSISNQLCGKTLWHIQGIIYYKIFFFFFGISFENMNHISFHCIYIP